ncbi:hypothetical protein Ahy_B04g070243 isoform B [Arachis hypogaea]|nr:hypothetical protein Ahy_B04g070243 isoform B [Arachis hypogaea]
MKTKARLSKSLDRDVSMAETFKYIHTLKENKERFTDQQSKNHYESYTQRLETATQQSQPIGEDGSSSADAVVDPDTVWHETASEPYKNCIYEVGSFFANNLHTSTFRVSSASATNCAIDPEDSVISLTDQVLISHRLGRSWSDFSRWSNRWRCTKSRYVLVVAVLLVATALLEGHRHHRLVRRLSSIRG